MATTTKEAPPKAKTSASTSPPGSSKPAAGGIKYEYMFKKDKSPTQQLDAVLRSVARHIACEIGDKGEKELIPTKLAAFYKAVGGDYDSLFERDNQSISWIWQVTGCQHSLQPTPDNDFAPPSIPALTPRGFSRWEALEILLGPEEHVPFLQHAVRKWKLKHPETGEPFPIDLPKDLFPLQADPDVDRWHKTCGEKLHEDASQHQKAEDSAKEAKSRGTPPEHSEPKYAYVHVNNPDPFKQAHKQPHSRPTAHRTRPFSYVHVPGRHPSHPSQRPAARSPEREPREPPPDERERRRSFSDYPSPTQERTPPNTSYAGSTFLDPNGPRAAQSGRRHSHPRHDSSDDSEPEPTRPQPRRRSPPPGNRRHAPPSAPPPPPPANNGRPQRPDGGLKRHNGNSPLGSIRDKLGGAVSGIFGSGRPTERPRTESRQNSYADSPRPPRRSPQRHQSARAPQRYSEDSSETSEPSDSSEDLRRRRRPRDDRQKDYHRDPRDRPYELDRELDDDVDHGRRSGNRPPPRRPDPFRRTSSHADIDRRRDQPSFDPRGRDRGRDERRRFERRSPDDRDSTSPMTGVSGRRYPPEATYT